MFWKQNLQTERPASDVTLLQLMPDRDLDTRMLASYEATTVCERIVKILMRP